MLRRIKRDYRQPGSPAKFLALCRRVAHGLTGNPNNPDSIADLLKQFLERLVILEALYHQALDGGRSLIREREKVSQEMVLLLDQLAAVLEAAFILNPDALLTTGFTITAERRSATRVKLPLPALSDLTVTNSGDPGKAVASAGTFPGPLVLQEIHINLGDPSMEADWFHKGIFHDPENMVMEGLTPGNTFFRGRLQGQDGPGPWSMVVSTTIT